MQVAMLALWRGISQKGWRLEILGNDMLFKKHEWHIVALYNISIHGVLIYSNGTIYACVRYPITCAFRTTALTQLCGQPGRLSMYHDQYLKIDRSTDIAVSFQPTSFAVKVI